MSYWKKGQKRIDLAAGLEDDLEPTKPRSRPGLRSAFQAAGFDLSDQTCVRRREGNDEWLVIDASAAGAMFLVRKESDGLNVYEEEQPARIAQFISSGLKNLKARHLQARRGCSASGFALLDLTPAERLIWTDKTPAAAQAARGRPLRPGRARPARQRAGAAADRATGRRGRRWCSAGPTSRGGWTRSATSARTASGSRSRRPGPLPEFDPTDVEGTYGKIASDHAGLLGQAAVRRGVVYQSNFGLVRFERDGEKLVACQDLYSHPPGKDEGGARERLPRPTGESSARSARSCRSTSRARPEAWASSSATRRRSPKRVLDASRGADRGRSADDTLVAAGRSRLTSGSRWGRSTRRSSQEEGRAAGGRQRDRRVHQRRRRDRREAQGHGRLDQGLHEALDERLRRGEDGGPVDRRRRARVSALPVRRPST